MSMFMKGVLAATLVCGFSGPLCAEPLSGTLGKIKETGSISLGVRETSVPFNYQGDDQKYIGFSLDLCLKVVDEVRKQLGGSEIKVVMTPTTAATRIPLLANGTTDMQCDGASNTADRQKQVSFSPTVFVTGNRILSKNSSNITSIDDLKGKSIVVMSGTTNARQIASLNTERNLGMKMQQVTEHSEALLMVETGRAAAYAQDDIYLAALIAGSKNPKDFTISKEALSVDPYGLMLRRDDPQFKTLVDKAITDLFKSGEFKTIYAKWFQAPIPPKNIDLNWPVSVYLQAVIDNPTDTPDPQHYSDLVAKPGAKQ